MNERILSPQLLKLVQAAGPGYSLADPEWVKKFAELIVKECCFTGEQYADGLFDPKHYAFVNKKIKEHFGVEE